MATQITFNDGSNPAINVPVPDYPGQTQEHIDQSIQQAMGGRVTSITRGTGVLKRWVLVWEMLATADYNTLKTFFNTTVKGATNSVTYTDENSANHTVKYLGGIERSQLVDHNSHRVEILLAQVA